MGMYDEVICKYPFEMFSPDMGELTDMDWSKVVFQTKDLDCCLNRYEITENGELWYKGDSLKEIEGWKRENIYLEWQDHKHWDGTARLYYSHFGDKFDYEIELKIRFEQSTVTDVIWTDWKESCNKERKKEEAKRLERIEAFKKFTKTFRYRAYKFLWKDQIRCFFRMMRWIGSRMQDSWRLEDKLLPW